MAEHDRWYSGDPQALVDAYVELVAIIGRPEWHSRAACRGQLDIMFPALGEPTAPARLLCAKCPVIDECADAGHGEVHGIWGGLCGQARRAARSRAA